MQLNYHNQVAALSCICFTSFTLQHTTISLECVVDFFQGPSQIKIRGVLFDSDFCRTGYTPSAIACLNWWCALAFTHFQKLSLSAYIGRSRELNLTTFQISSELKIDIWCFFIKLQESDSISGLEISVFCFKEPSTAQFVRRWWFFSGKKASEFDQSWKARRHATKLILMIQ